MGHGFGQHGIEPAAAQLRFFDPTDALPMDELLMRGGESLFTEPAPVRLAPVRPAGKSAAVPQKKAQRHLPACHEVLLGLPPATDKVTDGLVSFVGNSNRRQLPGTQQAREHLGVSPSVLIRSPGFFGIREGAMTLHSAPISMTWRYIPYPQPPAS